MGEVYKLKFFKENGSDETRGFYCESLEQAMKMGEQYAQECGYKSFRQSKGIYEEWKRPDFVTQSSEWFEWIHGKKKQKAGREDIEFVTDAGTGVVLKWQKSEFRAFLKKSGEDMMLGATVPYRLIEYIKGKY